MKLYTLLSKLEDKSIISRSDLERELHISESTLRNLKSKANAIGKYHGFTIQTIRERGYHLDVWDKEKYEKFLTKENYLPTEGLDADKRVSLMLYILLQSNEYITYEDLSNLLDVSKATVIRDFKEVEKKINESNLQLEKRSGYGIRVIGNEQDIRKVFSKYVICNSAYIQPVKGYFEFIKEIDVDEVTEKFKELLKKYSLEVTDASLANIVEHILILLYRSKQKKYINQFDSYPVEPCFTEIAQQIIDWLQERYPIVIDPKEVDLLAAHISGKTFSDKMISDQKEEITDGIKDILNEIDEEFLTNTKDDELLLNALIIHVLPLINRMYHNIQLTNPLIDKVYSEYANVFLLAMRFSDLIEKKYNFKLSKDEIGYIALHFATHFERMKNSKKEQYKKILVICGTGGGSAQLLKIKLKSIFPHASVSTIAVNNMKETDYHSYDLILTTIPLEEEYKDVPVIFIKEWLDENEIARIEEIIMMRAKENQITTTIRDIWDLFHEDLFYVDGIRDYKKMLVHMGDDAIKKGYANDHFTELVLERENRFATIYKNGVAGPHPMVFEAKKDSISVAVFEKPFFWENREVRVIFLINLRKGNLYLHKEISNILLLLIEKEHLLDTIAKCKTFKQFIEELKAAVL